MKRHEIHSFVIIASYNISQISIIPFPEVEFILEYEMLVSIHWYGEREDLQIHKDGKKTLFNCKN